LHSKGLPGPQSQSRRFDTEVRNCCLPISSKGLWCHATKNVGVKINIVLIALLFAGFVLHTTPSVWAPVAQSTTFGSMGPSDPSHVILWGTPNGWNGTWSANLNPSFSEFGSVKFIVNASWNFQIGGTYDFAIYTAGFPPGSVNTQNSCNVNNTNGCLVRSLTINTSLHSSWAVLTPSIPHDDFSGPGQYEYYDEYNPSIGHGTITVYKSPDVNSDGKVDIIDLATMAAAFGSSATPSPTPTWNPAADMNNNGLVDIIDLAQAASQYGQPI